MKWIIDSFIGNIEAKFIDGQPVINFIRDKLWDVCRLSTPIGFLDIIQTQDKLYLNEEFFILDKEDILHIRLNIDKNGKFTAETNTYISITSMLKPQPIIDQQYLNIFNEMFNSGLVPYPKIPDAPGKTIEEIKALGLKYFPHRADSFLLALSIYDWTTADFDRTVLFTQFCHTAIDNRPLDFDGVTDAIWSSHWPPYTPEDEYFMRSFLMKPAKSREEVADQLKDVSPTLYKYAKAETRVLSSAISCLPPTSTKLIPRLFSGQVDIGNLTTAHFAPGFFEFPLNELAGSALKMDLTTALSNFLSPGNIVTSKKIISFADTIEDAMHYQNGILLVAEPDEEDLIWETTAYVTPLSDDPKKIEYTFHAGAKFLVKNVSQENIDKKDIIVITLKPIGCLSPDLVASDKGIPITHRDKLAISSKRRLYPVLEIPTEKEDSFPLAANDYPILSTAPSVTLFGESVKDKIDTKKEKETTKSTALTEKETPIETPCMPGCCPIL